MGFIDPAFKNIKIGQFNFIIWRIENFEIKPIQASRYGCFYEGDSYIVYSAAPPVEKIEHVQIKNVPAKLEYHIHFWLGSKTSVDESTTAVIKTIELDEILNDLGIQHREIQGHESQRFKSYFKKGIRILKGGIASGLQHVTDDFRPRLFKIKGKRRPVLTEQSSVSWDHFNSGDVFILETKRKIFVWIGKESNKMEKFQAGKIAAQLRSERPEKTIVYVEEDNERNLREDDVKEFEEHLSLEERTIKPTESDISDIQNDLNERRIKLFKCTDQGGTFSTIFVKNGPLKQDDLNSEDSFIVDNNVHGIWVWIGKKASSEERSKGMSTAYEFITANNYPDATCVTRVVDGAEPIEFQLLFMDWKHPNASLNYNRQSSGKIVNLHFDAAKLHDSPALAAGTQLIDNGTGKAQVWRLHNKELETVQEEDFGVFFSGDCYLILYTYELRGKQNHMLYFWLGAHSSQDERGAIAWHAVKKDEELNGVGVQVRVVQSKEPPHFLIIFKGKMIVFNGGYASSFDGPEAKNVGIPLRFLLQVRGGEEHTTQSVEVQLSALSLNTNDVFVLRTEKKTYVWCGKGSTGDEREMAKLIAEERSLTKDYQMLFEGHEHKDFWELLGGQKPYANNERLSDPAITVPARLFHCSNANGYFKAEEIYDFSQYDLIPNDVMVLDIGKAVFIWVGKGANKTERLEAPKLIEDYLKTDPRGRDLDTPVITIQQGNEPPNFTGFFGAWDPYLWESALYKEFDSEISDVSKIIHINNDKKENRDQIRKYTVDVLANKAADELPDDVDALHRELHLSEEDFAATFGMKRIEYDALPTWKQSNLKKLAGLF